LFKEDIKVLNKTIKSLTNKLDNQLEHKNAHELEMQRMKNNYKQLGLDELREKLVNKKKVGGSSKAGAMTLEEKKDFVSHQAFVKQASKDSDVARAFQQKEIKRKDVQTNLRSAANTLHHTSNLNGGMWSSTSVGDVSYWSWLIVVVLSNCVLTNIILVPVLAAVAGAKSKCEAAGERRRNAVVSRSNASNYFDAMLCPSPCCCSACRTCL
jgi:hypothetical protein